MASSIGQLSLGLFEVAKAPPEPLRRSVRVNVQGVFADLSQLLPGFACVRVAECGSVAPSWNPERGVNLAERGIGLELLCERCLGAPVGDWPGLNWVPPRLIRRRGIVVEAWDPITGELLSEEAWVEVEIWAPALVAQESRARFGRFREQSRLVLTASGTQRWSP